MTYHLILSPAAALALEEVKATSQPNPPEIVTPAAPEVVPEDQATIEVEPVKENVKLIPLGIKGISAYNAGDPYQCDNSPCIAANGENICLALELGYKRCAANFVPFGTILEIEGYGRCLVVDRMNSRFSNHVDIAMKKTEKKEALKFGRRKLKVHIVKPLPNNSTKIQET